MWRKILIIATLVVVVLVAAAAVFVWRLLKSNSFQQAMIRRVEQKVIGYSAEKPIFNRLLGFEKPMTYLVLLLNNTELRPGGGFIGAYAVVRVSEGVPQILKIEGSEGLDTVAPKDFASIPPEPIKNFLKLDRWYFRDSNWSPDFALSSSDSLRLYTLEKGLEAENIDAVVGFTPTTIENLLKVMGSLVVDGETYTAENFTEKVEYAVEYGYAKEGIPFSERKKLLGELAVVLIRKLGPDIFFNPEKYADLAVRFIAERQLALFGVRPELQKEFLDHGWGGTMSTTTKDYLMWVDANLGALKTDAAIKRNLTYRISPGTATGTVATVAMQYVHGGKFDWRTSRYLTYARVYVPVGSKLISVKGSRAGDRKLEEGLVDSGVENGRQWFGAFTFVEPGKTGELSFSFLLAPSVETDIKNGSYDLYVQKQLGSTRATLTTDVDFGRRVVSASPGELKEKHGDTRYEVVADLNTDKKFSVKLGD